MDGSDLRPQTRPGRRGFWVRYVHPITRRAVRADLGTDPVEADAICTDLRTILANTNPVVWQNREHPDNDGLLGAALNEFYRHVDGACGILRGRLQEQRHLLLSREFEQLRLLLEGMKLENRIWFLMTWNRHGKDENEWVIKMTGIETPVANGPQPAVDVGEPIYRYGLPDGSVVYSRGEQSGKALHEQVRRAYSLKDCRFKYIWETHPDARYRPEMRAIFGSEFPGDGIPGVTKAEMKRWRCVYRIECPDGVVQYADGCVAFERLYIAIRQKHKIVRCKVAAELSDSLSSATKEELRRLYPTEDGSFKIPFPPEPPRRPHWRHQTTPVGGSTDEQQPFGPGT